jgi:hypothetical protein
MTSAPPTRDQYLERLRDLLPAREAPRIVEEVDSLLLDRMEAEQREPSVSADEAERRALRSLGTPEELAERLSAAPFRIDLATRRAFVRTVAVVFAGHLLLAVVLTAARAEAPALPGLLAPLPRAPLTALFGAVLGLFLTDLGGVLAVYLLLGRGRPRHAPSLPRLASSVSRRDSLVALSLLAVLAAIFHAPLRDQVFAVRHAGRAHPLLGDELLRLLPLLDVVLGLFALRHVWLLVRRRDGVVSVGLDALATLATTSLFVLACTRSDLLRLPPSLDSATAAILADLGTRALLLVFVAAALFSAIRFVHRLLLLRRVA